MASQQPPDIGGGRDLLRLVLAGSVDDGKSTLLGRMLYEAQGICEDQLMEVCRESQRRGAARGQPDLALLTDGLRAEREQGITIDVAYRYFSTPRRKFIIADAPGHEQYTPNMATGASKADLAVILIDATQGVVPQTRRHTFIASLLGIPHFVVAVNKMDLVAFSGNRFREIQEEFSGFATKLEARELTFIPVSALRGDNVVTPSSAMGWYDGPPLLSHLERVHIASDRNMIDLRYPVQYVTRTPDGSRVYMGTVVSGLMRPGDEVAVLPSGQNCHIQTVLGPGGELSEAFPPLPVGVTLTEDVDVCRGDMLAHVHNVPQVSNGLDAMVVWMDRAPAASGARYLLRHATSTIPAVIDRLRYRTDIHTLRQIPADHLEVNQIGRCSLTLGQPIAHDCYSRNRHTGAFLLVDPVTGRTAGAGMIVSREVEGSHQSPQSAHKVGSQAPEAVPERPSPAAICGCGCSHASATVWVRCPDADKGERLARALGRQLVDQGHQCITIATSDLSTALHNATAPHVIDSPTLAVVPVVLARLLNDNGTTVVCVDTGSSSIPPRRVAEIVGRNRTLMVDVSCEDAASPVAGESPVVGIATDARIDDSVPDLYDATVPGGVQVVLAEGVLQLTDSLERVLASLRVLTQSPCYCAVEAVHAAPRAPHDGGEPEIPAEGNQGDRREGGYRL